MEDFNENDIELKKLNDYLFKRMEANNTLKPKAKAWIITDKNGNIIHLSENEGWNVEAVIFNQ